MGKANGMGRAAVALACVGGLIAATAAAPLAAREPRQPAIDHAATEAAALDLAKAMIAQRSVRGPGNATPTVAALVRDRLLAGGWAARDIAVTPLDDTAYLIATWPGRDPKLKPLVISGHMDVVEARRADWARDPFTPVVEDGKLWGRGATDMKFDDALAIATLIALRKAGWQPRRTVIVALSGDEETTMHTSQVIAADLADAALVINIDGGGGTLSEDSGKPLFWDVEGSEKAYMDFQLEVTNPGGHSSEPRPVNAITQLAAAVARIGAYHFAPEQNAITAAWFTTAAPLQPNPTIAAAMRAFAANPADLDAVARLRAEPSLIGKVETTCVPTMLNGGHALNALPQRATANINCRVFPGHARDEIMAVLKTVAAEPALTITDVTAGSTASPASPLRPDVLAALGHAIHTAWPGVPIIPTQASGASDSMWYRVHGVDSYGASPVFTKASEAFSHGLNERVPLANLAPGVTYFAVLLPDLAG